MSVHTRVAARYLNATTNRRGTVIYHDDVGGLKWGWYVNRGTSARMHLTPMDGHHLQQCTIWLEEVDGDRAFEVDGDVSGIDVDALRAVVEHYQLEIEGRWLRHCQLCGWYHYNQLTNEITMYGGTLAAFSRELLALSGEAGRGEIHVDSGAQFVGVEHRLSELIWRGSR